MPLLRRHHWPTTLLLLLLPGAPLRAHDAALPLGDNRLSYGPQVGYLFSCRHDFDARAGGAASNVPWIRGDRWYPAEKAVVDGNVAWPQARLSVRRDGERRLLRGNDLPLHATGVYPIQPDDDAFRWDRNPNSIQMQDFALTLPAVPEAAPAPECVGGEVGVLLTGALLFSAIDAGGRDAVAHETQDRCNGHPQRMGQYHYHGPSACMADAAGANGRHSDLVGYALDGFGIYGLHGEQGRELRSADLDACHGHSHAVSWDGVTRTLYHYHFTADFPYSVGCFHGTPAWRGPLIAMPGGDMGERRGPPPRFGPPPGAFGPPPF